MRKTQRSPWKPQRTILSAQAASQAGRRHRKRLVKRLGNDFFDLLDADIRRLIEVHTSRRGSVEQMKGRTLALKETLVAATQFVVALRGAINVTYPRGHPMRSNFGVGIRTKPTSVKITLTALHMLVHGMEQYPQEAAAAGLEPEDLTRAKAFLDEISLADDSQEKSKDNRKAETSLAEELNYAVYMKLNRLKLAARLELADNPKAYNEIVEPLPGGSRSRKKDQEE